MRLEAVDSLEERPIRIPQMVQVLMGSWGGWDFEARLFLVLRAEEDVCHHMEGSRGPEQKEVNLLGLTQA